jgi:hypothetical protein
MSQSQLDKLLRLNKSQLSKEKGNKMMRNKVKKGTLVPFNSNYLIITFLK